MGNENKDVIRVFKLEAAIAAGIRAGMLAFATDTHRLARKKLSDSSMAYWSDDTLQMLLAGAQTVTGNKTYSGTSNFTGVVTMSELLKVSNEIALMKKEVTSITDGVTVIDPNDTAHIYLNNGQTAPAGQTAGLAAGNNDGQLLLITGDSVSSVELDGTVSGSAKIQNAPQVNVKIQLVSGQVALLYYHVDVNGDALFTSWRIIATNGTVV